jgi:hypothetical protein
MTYQECSILMRNIIEGLVKLNGLYIQKKLPLEKLTEIVNLVDRTLTRCGAPKHG